MKINNRILALATVFSVLTIYLISLSGASGVVTDYWKPDKPLKLYPGETREITFRLQNLPDTSADITMRATLIKGSEVATMEEKDYLVPGGSADTSVPMTVSIPDNVPVGTMYEMEIEFNTVAPSGGGVVTLGTGFVTTFDVEVIEAPIITPESEPQVAEGSNLWLIIAAIALLIIIVIVIIIIIIKRKKKNSSPKVEAPVEETKTK